MHHDALLHLLGHSDDYRLVLVDVRMPGMSGFEFALQVHEINPDIKIVMMTAFEIDLPEFTMVFPFTKVDDLIEKPFSMNDLMAVISKHVALKKRVTSDEYANGKE